jgi:hypothetical protein
MHTPAQRRREMHDIVCKPRKRVERLRPIEISPHRRDAERAQRGEALRSVGERENAAATAHQRNHAQRHVAATYNE